MRAISHKTSGANRQQMNAGGRPRRLAAQRTAATQLGGTDPFFLILPADLGNLDDGDVLGSTTRWGNRGRCGILGASGHEPTITRDPVTGRLGAYCAIAATDTWLDSEQDALGSNVASWHWASAVDAGGYTGPDSRAIIFYANNTSGWNLSGVGGWLFNLSGGPNDVPAYATGGWGTDPSGTEIEYEVNVTEPLYLATYCGICRRTAGTGRYPATYMDEDAIEFNPSANYSEPLPTGAAYRFSLGAYSDGSQPLGANYYAAAYWDYDTDETELRRRQRLLRAASNLWSAA